MSRVIKKPGYIFQFPLSTDELHGYAQWLEDGTARIFLFAGAQSLSLEEIVSLPAAFRVLVFKDTPGKYGWSKIGAFSIPEEVKTPQRYAKKDPTSGQLSIYFQGTESPATADDLRGLETLAVWAHPHIVERLEAQIDGRESQFLSSVAIAL